MLRGTDGAACRVEEARVRPGPAARPRHVIGRDRFRAGAAARRVPAQAARVCVQLPSLFPDDGVLRGGQILARAAARIAQQQRPNVLPHPKQTCFSDQTCRMDHASELRAHEAVDRARRSSNRDRVRRRHTDKVAQRRVYQQQRPASDDRVTR